MKHASVLLLTTLFLSGCSSGDADAKKTAPTDRMELAAEAAEDTDSNDQHEHSTTKSVAATENSPLKERIARLMVEAEEDTDVRRQKHALGNLEFMQSRLGPHAAVGPAREMAAHQQFMQLQRMIDAAEQSVTWHKHAYVWKELKAKERQRLESEDPDVFSAIRKASAWKDQRAIK